ncbi:MAG: GNAT family N-acetyltransferase [Pseudomonadota bacterium]
MGDSFVAGIFFGAEMVRSSHTQSMDDILRARAAHVIGFVFMIVRDRMAYVSLEPFKYVIGNGLHIFVRDVVPEDGDLIELGFDRLSKQSRFLRFMAAKKRLTGRELEQFSALNTMDHAAFGALHMHENGVQPAGIARYVRTAAEDEAAEIAVTIVDAFQNLGIGTLLLGVLAKNAYANGIREFFALVAKNNIAMRHLLRELGGTEELSDEPEVSTTLNIYQDPKYCPDNKVGAYVRRAYSQAELTVT